MKNQTFEEYLRDDCWHPEGVLDDDMPDAFDDWLTALDTQELIDYADLYGYNIRKQMDKEFGEYVNA